MMLKVFLDLGNVAGYLALPGIKALVAETNVDVEWLPIAGIVPRPLSREPNTADNNPLAEYKHLRWQAKSKFEQEELKRDCERLKLDPNLAAQSFDATLTHQAWLDLLSVDAAKAEQFVEAVYAERFRQGNALEAREEVERLLTRLDVRSQPDDASRANWEKHVEGYLALGIHDSPSFVLGEETFQGRQHFPLLKWRIQDAAGELQLGPAPV